MESFNELARVFPNPSLLNADRLREEVRHLPVNIRNELTSILDLSKRWRDVLTHITHPDRPETMLFEDQKVIGMIENCPSCSPSDEILKSWSTTGKRRPVIADLILLLHKVKLYRAINLISLRHLNGPPICWNERYTASELISSSISSRSTQSTNGSFIWDQTYNHSIREEAIQLDLSQVNVHQYRYCELLSATENFATSRKVGEGTFGEVYKCSMEHYTVAVKRFKGRFTRELSKEIHFLTNYFHANILTLLGASADGPHHCLVYLFMENGSLEDCLLGKNEKPCIQWQTRIQILLGVADGLNFLHTRDQGFFVHRDIKSANILLDEEFTPKIGDFDLIRKCDTNTVNTQTCSGTSAYMANEAWSGEITSKLDVYSFGIVMMETLTALEALDVERCPERLIAPYIKYRGIMNVLDNKGGEWDKEIAQEIYDLSLKCTEYDKDNRPSMAQVYDQLLNLQNRLGEV